MTSLAHYIYVAEGFMEDCDMLIRSLTDKYEKVDWQKFCKHWKELQFDIIFYGRLSGAELAELTEECLQCARLYMVTETDNYEDQVVGIFIAYAITLIQPYNNFCSLRLTQGDVAPMKRVEAIARRDNRTDVLMILGRLYVYSTHFHVSARERAMDFGIRKYFDDSIRVPKTIHREWHGELNRKNIRDWEKISEVEEKYMESKKRFKLIASTAYPGSNVLLDTAVPIAGEISDSLRKLIMNDKKEGEKDEKREVISVKEKAMKNAVNPMNHLTGIDARKAAAKSPRTKSPDNIEPKTTPKSVRKKIKDYSQNVLVGKSLKQYIKPVHRTESKITEPSTKPLSYLDDDVSQEAKCTRVDTPEEPFKGFTAKDIEKTNAALCDSDLDSPTEETKKRRRNNKQSPKSDLEDSNNIEKKKKGRNSTSKIAKNIKTETKKRKRPSPKKTAKKKSKSKLSSESDSNTVDSSIDNDHTDDNDILKSKENIKKSEQILIEESKGEEKNLIQYKENGLTEETNGIVKDFVQYKVNDFVIHAEQGLPDLEIELIDQYNEPVNNDATEKPHAAVGKDMIDLDNLNIPENINGEKETTDTVDSEETVEVVRILTESEAAVIQTKESMVVPRRNRKRPSLQSKLRRMGILPVANFYNDEDSNS